MKLYAYIFALLLLFSAAICYSKNNPPADSILGPPHLIDTFEKGKLYLSAGNGEGHFNILILNGSWRRMGRQYGYFLKNQMNDFYQTAVKNIRMSHDQIKSSSETAFKGKPSYMQELINGMSETSGFSIEKQKIICLLIHIIEIESGNKAGCSTLSAWGDYTGGKPLVIGRNYDWGRQLPPYNKFLVAVVFNPAGSHNSVVDINYIGAICYVPTSMNSSGIYTDMHGGSLSEPKIVIDVKRYLSFFAMIQDSIFNCSSIAEFETRLLNRDDLPTAGVIVNIADAQECRVYELATYDAKKRTGKGLAASSNHFISPDWKGLPSVQRGFSGGFSLERITNLINLGEQYKGKIGANQMMEIFDKSLYSGGPTDFAVTNFQVVSMPSEKIMWIKVPGFSNWDKIDLNLFFE